MKQLTRIFLSIIFLFGVCDQILLGQQEKAKAEICNEQLLPLYKAYFEERDKDERYKKAKLYLEKVNQLGCGIEEDFINPNVRQFVKRVELTKIFNKCTDADKAYYSKPDLTNLNLMITACDPWVKKAPSPDHYFPTRLAIATGFGVLAGFYKDTDQTFLFAERALETLAKPTTPRDWKEVDWLQFRRENIGRLLQYQGLCKLRQSSIDAEAAIIFFTKAADLKDGSAYADVNTYLLRAEANMMGCPLIKEALEVCPAAEQIMEDYVRVVALSFEKPELKSIHDDAYEQAQVFWNLTHLKNTQEKLDDLINTYKAEFRKK